MNQKNLLDKISSIESLKTAWNQLNKENEDSHGLSGVSIKDFEKGLDKKLDRISNRLGKGNFEFRKTRAAVIKKDNGSLRPLQIPEIEDRVVLKAIQIQLEKEFSETLKESEETSFAYQRGKGVREAVLQMKIEFDKAQGVILKADIIKFFEKINKEKLIKEVIIPKLSDNSIDALIIQALNQELGGVKRFDRITRRLFSNASDGIPQGNPISPLLSNIYLLDFDRYVKQEGMTMIRYADDFIVLFNSEKEAEEGYEKIQNYLKERYALQVHPLEKGNPKAKTQIIDPKKNRFEFLSITFDGSKLFPGKDKLGILKSKITKTIKEFKGQNELYSELYKTIDKWVAIYSYLSIEKYFDTIDAHVIYQLKKHIGKGKYNTPKSCKNLTQSRRIKQKNKSKNSFWKRPKLMQYLPKIGKARKNIAPNKMQKRQ